MRGNLFRHFLMQLSQKRKDFSEYYLHFLNLNSIVNIFQKKKNDPHSLKVFLNLRTPKSEVKSMTKRVPFQRTLRQVTWKTGEI